MNLKEQAVEFLVAEMIEKIKSGDKAAVQKLREWIRTELSGGSYSVPFTINNLREWEKVTPPWNEQKITYRVTPDTTNV